MNRWERRAEARRRRAAAARRAKVACLAAGSLALIPFVGGGTAAVPVALAAQQAPPAPVHGADGTVTAQTSPSADLLAAAGDPLLLAQQAGPSADVPIVPLGAPSAAGGSGAGIPAPVLVAYQRAERSLAQTAPSCRLSWPLLASIGRIESGHARGGRVDGTGRTLTPILGPPLNGSGGFAAIADTDGGRYDGDPVWDRAVGPMQFIPGTWAGYTGDGVHDPDNINDSTVAAGRYLCAGGGDLSDPRQRAKAVFRYNHSDAYVRTVLLWADAYAHGVTAVPVTGSPAPMAAPVPPPAAPVAHPAPAPVPPPAPPVGPVLPPVGPKPPTKPSTGSSSGSPTSKPELPSSSQCPAPPSTSSSSSSAPSSAPESATPSPTC
ncbi:lytic transglycosylase domain-containing protein [Amycolatopsis minnesotensis]|uniref:Membrane-bound lytic murein transglycosylase B n=1 Tax=Amycolatopsis minnesotensis TaxID=337894 RepID=A0ABP5CWH3_9PSEU